MRKPVQRVALEIMQGFRLGFIEGLRSNEWRAYAAEAAQVTDEEWITAMESLPTLEGAELLRTGIYIAIQKKMSGVK